MQLIEPWLLSKGDIRLEIFTYIFREVYIPEWKNTYTGENKCSATAKLIFVTVRNKLSRLVEVETSCRSYCITRSVVIVYFLHVTIVGKSKKNLDVENFPTGDM